MWSAKVQGKGMSHTTQLSYPLSASLPITIRFSSGVRSSGSDHQDSAFYSACGAVLGTLPATPRLYEEKSWVETHRIFLIERNLVRTEGPLKINPGSKAALPTFMALHSTQDLGCCYVAVQCWLSTELREEQEGTGPSSFPVWARQGKTVSMPP